MVMAVLEKDNHEEIRQYLDKIVVVDTNTYFLFIGKLLEISDYFITLGDVDVHDSRESPSTKEKYIIDTKKMGVKVNRRRVHIRFQEVISISALEDVIDY